MIAGAPDNSAAAGLEEEHRRRDEALPRSHRVLARHVPISAPPPPPEVG